MEDIGRTKNSAWRLDKYLFYKYKDFKSKLNSIGENHVELQFFIIDKTLIQLAMLY
ncbi:hypothetical protein [Clostridium thailandense]|uniref:hypothetical protein n=1 Tax=Clostridium thailandense TaxID=2794346 RepID=UPI003988AAFC